MASLHKAGIRPTGLRRGELIRRRNGTVLIVWTFIKRVPAQLGRPAHCVLHSDTCRGQNGPDDLGYAVANDYSISRDFERVDQPNDSLTRVNGWGLAGSCPEPIVSKTPAAQGAACSVGAATQKVVTHLADGPACSLSLRGGL